MTCPFGQVLVVTVTLGVGGRRMVIRVPGVGLCHCGQPYFLHYHSH